MPKKKRKSKSKKKFSKKIKGKIKTKKKSSKKRKVVKKTNRKKKPANKKILNKTKKIKKNSISQELIFKTRPEWIKSSLANKSQYQNKYNESIKNNNSFWKKEGKRITWIKPYKKSKILNIVKKK